MGNAIYRKDTDGMKRVRNARHKDDLFVRARKMSYSDNVLAPSDYQQWVAYPQSPVLTEEYPYQSIVYYTFAMLVVSTKPYYFHDANNTLLASEALHRRIYGYENGAWVLWNDNNISANLEVSGANSFYQSNCDVYLESAMEEIYFHKTTTDSQEEHESWKRVNL